MRIFFIIFLFFINKIVVAQQLHHEMISAQGGSVTTANGQFVRYSVGQQSVTGTSSNGYVVQQGFQQSNWSKILEQNTISIATTVYPNPFVNEINFSFSTSPGDKISAYVFDVLGRLVYSEDLKNENNSIKLSLLHLSTAEYLVKLSSDKFVHSAKIIKK
ncbi:T9SS type A sorting domain-containing protein [Flavobacterium sp.]|uniref:T9SS type A sorting domain-containing protein n=1 Tax=Flavobacterium sp. TaxID=239 RepID=UPI003341CE83